MSAHTPGPWEVYGRDSYGGVHVGTVADDPGHIVTVGEGTLENNEADARLIAAAPELAEALEAMRRCPGVHQTDQETGETFDTLIRAALAKAGL